MNGGSKQTHNVKWKASLSSGETCYEEKGAYRTIPGELSPWNRLQAHIATHNLTITSLALYTDEGATFHLPSSGSNPKFHAFASGPKPRSYRLFRAVGQDIYSAAEDHFSVIEAQYDSYCLQLWVDEANPKNCWVNLVEGGVG